MLTVKNSSSIYLSFYLVYFNPILKFLSFDAITIASLGFKIDVLPPEAKPFEVSKKFMYV